MSQIHERPSALPWSMILFVSAVAIAIILAYLVPLPWPSGPFGEFLFAVGCLLAAGGVALIVLAVRALARAKTTVNPMRPASHLVTSGPYAVSRNPIYLGKVVVMIAIALIAGSPWFIVMGLVAGLAAQQLAIVPEEKHLALRFGRHYRDYAKKARRWI